MSGAWLVTSGAYVEQELSVEFGSLPPSFLPVGNKRLYEYQFESIGAARPIYLTLPESYVIPENDRLRLAELDITVLGLPDGLSLGESIVFALNLIAGPDQPIRILHGDTLVQDLSADGLDEAGIAPGRDAYSWAEVQLDGAHITGIETVIAGAPKERGAPVLCGYFAFAHSAGLVRAITRARGSFTKGVMTYAHDNPLSAVPISGWYDFGHLQTYFRSRRVVVTARAFNSLIIDELVARKSSSDGAKMQAEANWIAAVPPKLRAYTARLIDQGTDNGTEYYETEYEYLPTLSELFVFGALGRNAWHKITQSCHEFLEACTASTGPGCADDALRALVVTKTIARLQKFAGDSGFNIDAMLRYEGRPLPSLMQIAADLEAHIDLASQRPQTVMHGDFCFSNILFDARVQRIRVIDPRGYVEPGQPAIYGDIRYDLAKLAHSVLGRYDQIIAGRYAMPAQDGHHFSIEFEPAPHHAWLADAMQEFSVDGIKISSPTIRAVTVSLFLSMLPLHADRPDRQRAYIANALRLYAALESVSA